MASLTDREVTIGDTTFVIEPMPALAAHDLFEEIWDELGLKLEAGLAQDMAAGVAVAAAGQDNDIVDVSFLAIPALAEIINKVLQVRRPFKVRLRGKLFQHVRFHNDRAVTPQPLAGWETNAFQKLPAVAVTELMVRCLAVNFTESWEYVASILPKPAPQDTDPSPPSD